MCSPGLWGWALLLIAVVLPETVPAGRSTYAQSAGLQAEIESLTDDLRGNHDRFGMLFARWDGAQPEIAVAGDIRPDDALRLGSVSKVFLAFMVLREGIDLDAPIQQFFPREQHPRSDAITPRHLLSHTSGIPDEMVRRAGEMEPAEVLAKLKDALARGAVDPDVRIRESYSRQRGLDFEPGTSWCYSNNGYLVLGRLLERVTGRPVGDLVPRHFGRVAPSLFLDDGRDAAFPSSYLTPWPIHWSQPWVAGGIVAPARDALAAFHHVSSQPEFTLMQQWVRVPRCDVDVVAGDDYGLGLQRYVFEGSGEGIGHDGHIIARTLIFRMGASSYLLHTTRPVGNVELRSAAARLLRALGPRPSEGAAL